MARVFMRILFVDSFAPPPPPLCPTNNKVQKIRSEQECSLDTPFGTQ